MSGAAASASTAAAAAPVEWDGKRVLQETQAELVQLLARIREIKDKAETSEQMVLLFAFSSIPVLTILTTRFFDFD